MTKKTIKRVMSLFVTFAMMAALLPAMPALADSVPTGGSAGNITWDYTIDTEQDNEYYDHYILTINGSGALDSSPWLDTLSYEGYYDIEISKIVIGNGITSIGDSVFYSDGGFYNWVEEVTFPETLTSIGNSAFANLDTLWKVKFPSSLRTIGDRAFYNCNIHEMEFSEGLTSIGEYAFWADDYGGLDAVRFPSTLESLGASSFYGYETLRYIEFSGALKTIGDEAFSNYDSTRSRTVILPAGVQSIGDKAFVPQYESNNVSIYYAGTEEQWQGIQKTEDDYGEGAMDDTGSSSGVYIYCNSNITCDIEGDTLTLSGNGKLGHYYGYPEGDPEVEVTKLVFGDGITSISQSEVFEYRSISQVSIPPSVTEIGDSAFSSLDDLKEIVIPKTVTSIADSAFDEWYMDTIYYTGTEEEWVALNADNPMIQQINFVCVSDDASWGLKDGKLIILKETALADRASADETPWANVADEITSVEIKDGITKIGNYAFAGCGNLFEASIPGSVTSVGNYAFADCSALMSADLPANAETVGAHAYDGCSNIVSAYVPVSVTSIGESAFAGCDKLAYVGYTGGSDAWNAISGLNDASNAALKSASVRYEYGGITYELTPNDDENPWGDGSYTLTISGVGSMDDYEYASDAPWYYDDLFSSGDYASDMVSRVVIEDGITYVGSHAFYGYERLNSVTIADSVLRIGEYAFCSSGSLTYVKLPARIERLEKYAFNLGTAGSGIVIPKSIKFIGEHGVAGQIDYPLTQGERKNVFNIYYSGTEDDWNSVTKTESDYPYELGDILYESEGITWQYENGTLTINGKGKMGSWAGSAPWNKYARDITKVVIGDGLTTVGGGAFEYYYTALAEVTLPQSVTSIEDGAFDNCKALEDIDIPQSVTAIGNDAFSQCEALTELTLPQSLTTIGDFAFSQCKALTELTLPQSLKTIGNDAFSNCDYLETVEFPQNMERIGDRAFQGCTRLVSADLPDGLTEIGDELFSGDSYLTSVHIPYTVTRIGNGAFSDCLSLARADIPDGVTEIGEQAFSRCESLESIVIPPGLTTISSAAFALCYTVREIVIPETVTAIEGYAFNNCQSLEKIEIPGTVETIGEYAFGVCSSAKRLIINDGVKVIGEQAFNTCSKLTEVEIPSSLTNIDLSAFRDCPSIEKVYYDGTKLQLSGITKSGNDDLLNAELSQSSIEFTLTYDACGGTGAPEPQNKTRRDNYVISDVVPTRAGYTFHGWTDVRSSAEAKYHAGDTITVTGDLTLYAVWDPDFTVSIPSDELNPKILDTIKIPVSISGNRGFATLGFSMKFDTDKYEFVGVERTSMTYSASSVEGDSTAGGANVLIVNNRNITTDGELVNVILRTKVAALNTTSTIEIEPSESVRDDMTPAIIKKGNVSTKLVLNVDGDANGDNETNSTDVLAVSRYKALYKNHGMTNPDNADVYTDGVINLKDIYVLSRYAVMTLSSLSAAEEDDEAQLYVNERPQLSASAVQTENGGERFVDVTVSLTNNTGFTGIDFALYFDKSKLNPVSITNGALTTDSLVSNIQEPGVELSDFDVVTAVWTSDSEAAVSGSGALYTVRFKIVGDIGDDDTLTFEKTGFLNGIDDVDVLFPSKIALDGETVPEPPAIVIADGKVSVTGSADGVLIVAGYDNNGCVVKTELVSGYEKELSQYADCAKVSAFLWNSIDSMMPLCESKSDIRQ